MSASHVFSILAGTSACIQAWQLWCGCAHSFRGQDIGRGRRPGVTVLKPLKGVDDATEACLRSWMSQNEGGGVQVLFGVHDASDPAAALVSRLIGEFPGVDAALVVCSGVLGPNGKISTLAQLEGSIRHEWIVVSDADVWAPPGLLAQLWAGLESDGAGLANCLYRLATPRTPAMQLEAIGVNADFWSQVLQSAWLREIDFALGAVMALRRRELEAIGGFRSLVDCLADDYQLGRRIAGLGRRIVLVPAVVECREGERGWREVWAHQVRWSRTIRVCQPWAYFASVISNLSFWVLLAVLVAGGSGALMWGLAGLGFRCVAVGVLRRRLGDGWDAWGYAWLAPVKDLMSVVIWGLAFVGSTVEWRGRRYRVDRTGRLENVGRSGEVRVGGGGDGG